MTIRDLIKGNAAYGSIACIKGEESVSNIRGYLAYNFDFIKGFDTIIVVVNWLDGVLEQTVEDYLDQWFMAFPNSNVQVIRRYKNYLHTLGTMDLDNSLLRRCKELNIKWLFKSTEDVIVNSTFLDKEIPQGADFYYLNGIGKGGMVKYDFDSSRIIKEDFYPNTNFYIINTESIDYLYDEYEVDDAYEQISKIENYSGRIWEYIPRFSSEGKLAESIIYQGLTVQHLLSPNLYCKFLEIIDKYNIHDNSHKNVSIEGICHFHYPDQPVIIIE